MKKRKKKQAVKTFHEHFLLIKFFLLLRQLKIVALIWKGIMHNGIMQENNVELGKGQVMQGELNLRDIRRN